MPPPSPESSHQRLRWLYPVALAATVFVASGRSHVAAPGGIDHIDKLAHFSIFGLLATLVARAPGVRRLRYAILIASLYGIGDEFRQSFTPGRSVEFADWIADTLGAATAVSLYAFWPWYRRLLERPLFLRRRTRDVTAPLAVAAPDPASAPAA